MINLGLRLILLLLAGISVLPAYSKTLPDSLTCDYGKGSPQTEQVRDFIIQLNPEKQTCHLLVSIGNDAPLFEYTSVGIEVSSAVDLKEDGQPFILVKTTLTPSSKLFLLSLGSSPGLVATVENQYGFWLQDGCRDGRWRIWTADGAFQNDPKLTDIYHYDDIVPEIILEFDGNRFVDGTPHCKEYFDRGAKAVKAHLSARRVARFRRHAIRDQFQEGQVKGNILQLVFAYLYTGREKAAKHVLSEMWPPDEVDEIWEWVTKKRSEGLLRQISSGSKDNGGASAR